MSGTNDLFVISKYGKYLYRMSKENIELTKVLHGLFKGDLPRLDENIHNGKLLYGQYVKYCENQDWDCFWKFEFDYKLLFGKPREVLNRIIDAVDEDVRKSQGSYSFYTNQANSVFDGLKKQFKEYKFNDVIYWLFVIFVLFILYRISTHWIWEWFGWILCFWSAVFLFYIYTCFNNVKFFGKGLYILITGFLTFACYKIWFLWWIIKCLFYGIQAVICFFVSPSTFSYMLVFAMAIVCLWACLQDRRLFWAWVFAGLFIAGFVFSCSLMYSRDPAGEELLEEMNQVHTYLAKNETLTLLKLVKVNILDITGISGLLSLLDNASNRFVNPEVPIAPECMESNKTKTVEYVNVTTECPIHMNNGSAEELIRLSNEIEALRLKSPYNLSCYVNMTEFNRKVSLSCPKPSCPEPKLNMTEFNRDVSLSCPKPSCPAINITEFNMKVNLSCPKPSCPEINMTELADLKFNLSCPKPICPEIDMNAFNRKADTKTEDLKPKTNIACPRVSQLYFSLPDADIGFADNITHIIKQACPKLEVIHIPMITEINERRYENKPINHHRKEDGPIIEAYMYLIDVLMGHMNLITGLCSAGSFRFSQIAYLSYRSNIMKRKALPNTAKEGYFMWVLNGLSYIFGNYNIGKVFAHGAARAA